MPLRDRVARRAETLRLPHDREVDLSAALAEPDERARKMRAPGADEARDAQDLAAAQRKGRRVRVRCGR